MIRYGIEVGVKNREMLLRTDCGLTGAGHPHLYLRSSASSAPVLDERAWPVGLAWSVTDRLRNGGDRKGRVIGMWQELPKSEPVPLAALAWHAHGSGPLYAFDLGHATTLDTAVGRRLTAVLLDTVLQAAAHRNTPWPPTGDDGCAGRRRLWRTRRIESAPTTAKRTSNGRSPCRSANASRRLWRPGGQRGRGSARGGSELAECVNGLVQRSRSGSSILRVRDNPPYACSSSFAQARPGGAEVALAMPGERACRQGPANR